MNCRLLEIQNFHISLLIFMLKGGYFTFYGNTSFHTSYIDYLFPSSSFHISFSTFIFFFFNFLVKYSEVTMSIKHVHEDTISWHYIPRNMILLNIILYMKTNVSIIFYIIIEL
ncbi:hypothetical protein AAZX31_07G218300 [Glycine max]